MSRDISFRDACELLLSSHHYWKVAIFWLPPSSLLAILLWKTLSIHSFHRLKLSQLRLDILRHEVESLSFSLYSNFFKEPLATRTDSHRDVPSHAIILASSHHQFTVIYLPYFHNLHSLIITLIIISQTSLNNRLTWVGLEPCIKWILISKSKIITKS